MKGVEQIEHTLHNLASPKRSHTFWGMVVTLLVACGLLWLKHGAWLGDPNGVIFGESPDGFKNYMTSTWHVVHDSSYVHYDGMGYPFGEHVLFTDNQPILSAAMQWWSHHVADVRSETVGLINLFQVLSLLLGVGVVFLLLRKLHLPVWYAGLVALGIVFLSPQYNRFDGHFGLSHTWVLPMLLLLLCRYEERSSRRYQSLLIGFLVWFAGQLHFYNFGVSALFLGIYTGFQILFNFNWTNIWRRASHLAVMVLLPFALLNVWVHWSDYLPDRPASPYGFTTYIGYWEGVFLPYENFPMFQWIDKNIIPIRRIDYEAQAYAGVVAFVFTLWLLFKRRFRMFEPSWDEAAYHRVHKGYLRGIFATGFTLLVFGCGFPFAIKGLEWMADYLGPFRQFRGLGRFTWAFYYVVNVLAFYVLWNRSVRFRGFFKKEKLAASGGAPAASSGRFPQFRWAIALLPLAILCWEAFYFQQHKALKLSPNVALPAVAAPAPDHWLKKVDFKQFQALMPLPYYHIGSENIWLDMYYPLYRKVQITALQTGVPDMGVNMSRYSVGRMVKSMQWALPPSEVPALIAQLPDNRPIALMIEPEKWSEVQVNHPHLVQKATPVYDGPELKILSLVPDSVRAWVAENARNVSAEMNRVATFSARGGWRTTVESGWLHSQRFDSLTTARHIFQGTGAYEGTMSDTTWIWNAPMPRGHYFISLWLKADQDMGMTHELKIFENSLADGHEVFFGHEGLRFHLKTIVQGWALFDLPFHVREDNTQMRLFLQKKGVHAPFWLDEAMIKASSFSIYRREPGWTVRNNFWYKMEGVEN
jgi:hypothetical protein